MNKAEQVALSSDTKKYIEEMKLRPLFYSLTKLLCEARPADPIKYLIEHLENSKRKRLICVQGFQGSQCNEVGSNIANKFNFKLLDLPTLLKVKDVSAVDDDRVNQTLQAAMAKVESVYKGVVVSGYPNNLIQANFMQQNAYLPERLFMLPFVEENMEKHYLAQGRTAEEAKLLVTRDMLNLRELKEVLKELPDWLPADFDRQADIINTTLKVRDKKVMPLEAPRILVLHPPYLRPSVLPELCERYCLNLVTLEGAFMKLKSRKQDYERYVRKHEQLSSELQLALVQTECTSIASKNKGFVLSGWPNDVKFFVYAQEHFISPHILLVFLEDKEKLVKLFEGLDPEDHSLFPIRSKPTVEEYRSLLLAYDRLAAEAKKSERCQSFMLTEQSKEVLRSFESLIGNAKLYS